MKNITQEQFNNIVYSLARNSMTKHFSILKDGQTKDDVIKAEAERRARGEIDLWRKPEEVTNEYDAISGEKSTTFEELNPGERAIAIAILGAGLLYSLRALRISINDPEKIEKVRANLIESFNKVDDFFKLKVPPSVKRIKDKYKEDYEALKVDRDVYINSISIKQLKELSKHLTGFNSSIRKDLIKSIKGNVDNDERKRLIKYFETKI